jgi:hypothetical protein
VGARGTQAGQQLLTHGIAILVMDLQESGRFHVRPTASHKPVSVRCKEKRGIRDFFRGPRHEMKSVVIDSGTVREAAAPFLPFFH